MSFQDCITRGVNGGEIDPKRAERIVAEHEALFNEFQNTMGATQADYQAARHIVDKARREAAENRRVKQLQAATARRNLERMAEHKTLGFRGDDEAVSPGDFVQDLLSNKRGGVQGNTLAGLSDTIRRSFRRELTEATEKFRANLLGMRRNKDTLRNMEKAIFGEETDDAFARAQADVWKEVAEKARTRFNAAGGHIGKRADWGLPQSHDMKRVSRVPYEEWRDFILPKLDLETMGRDFNDGIAFTGETIELLLRDAYDAIRSDGYSRRSPSARRGGAMYNRRADHRFFKFNNSDDWRAYNETFGSGQDTFRIMLGHLDNMANEIALMETLGPNPTAGYEFVKDAARGAAATADDPKAFTRVQSRLTQADHMFDQITGRNNIPGNEAVAKGMSAVRAYLTSAHLGSAIFSSVTDFNTQRVAAGFVGMKRLAFTKQMARLMASSDFRSEASRAGLVYENAVDVGNAAARYEMETMHVEAAARMSDFTIRASGLGYLTEIQRQSFGMEFMSTVASKWRQLPHDQLEPKTQRVLEAYGISAREWDVIRKAPVHRTGNGLEIVRAQEIEEAGHQDVADRYMEAIMSLTEFAVPSTDIYGRAMVAGRTQAGTISGELVRSFLQFKAFPITILTTQMSRIMAEAGAGRARSAAGYAASLFVGATLLGAMALQMKDVSKGRDPRDMSTKEFWMQAAMQGGGLGIFGDFLLSDVNRFGGGLAETIAGPTIGFFNDARKFTVGNIQDGGKNIGRELTQMLRSYTPGGSLWQTRLAYERLILDELQTILDPKARDSFRARARGAEQFGTQFFAPPGEGLDGLRAPDFSNALGDR